MVFAAPSLTTIQGEPAVPLDAMPISWQRIPLATGCVSPGYIPPWLRYFG